MISADHQSNNGLPLLTYTADQVCAMLQISKVTLWRLGRRRLLRPLSHLRHKRFSAEEVRRFASGLLP